MPIGEDIPMLIPISIILTVLILFLVGIFINLSEQNELIRMSQVSLDVVDYSANIVFSDTNGMLDYSKIKGLGVKSTCDDLDKLNISASYNVKMNISDISTNEWWCWENTAGTDTKTSITNTVPFSITNGNHTDLGKVVISVSK